MPAVRQELGPSLPQLAAPHWRALTRRRQIVLVVSTVLVLVVLAVGADIARHDPLKVVVVRAPLAFNLVHRGDFPQVKPVDGELLSLHSLPGAKSEEAMTVRRLVVPPYRGDISSALVALATRRLAQLQAADPTLEYRGEGKTRINLVPGYQLSYQSRVGSRLLYGRTFFLVPEPAAGQPQTRIGAELTLVAQRSGQTPNVLKVGSSNLLKSPLRSFRFGTQRP